MAAGHKFRNINLVIDVSERNWQLANSRGLLDIVVKDHHPDGSSITDKGHCFVNLTSGGYLGLQKHPKVRQGAIDALIQEDARHLSMSCFRIRPSLMDEVEKELSDLWKCRALLSISTTAASSGLLPLIASGHFTDGTPPTMAFDRFAHFSMAYLKPICAEETEVVSCPHNDLNFLEDLCKKKERVAFVADGAHSTGGGALIDELFQLQDRYGLFLYLDDSHSLSIVGKRGEGVVRSRVSELNEHTIIVATLMKGFGTSGGVMMLPETCDIAFIRRHGGPLGWSQCPDNSLLGATRASAQIHASEELGELQRRLAERIVFFDEEISTAQRGDSFPIRKIAVHDDKTAIEISGRLFEEGFYVSPLYFPIVPQGTAGLRFLLRADLEFEHIRSACSLIRRELERYAIA